MINLLKELEEICDIIILDGTPSLIVTDAVILSRFVDSTIIVTAQNRTKIDDLNKVKKDIDNVGGKLAGVVINRIEVNSKEYQDRYYYYGHKSNLPVKTKKKEKYYTENLNSTPRKKTSSSVKSSQTKVEKKNDNNINEEDVLKTNEILSSLNTYLENEKNKMK